MDRLQTLRFHLVSLLRRVGLIAAADALAGPRPALVADGTAADGALQFVAANGARAARVTAPAAAVNWPTLTAAITGSPALVQATGDGTDGTVDLALRPTSQFGRVLLQTDAGLNRVIASDTGVTIVGPVTTDRIEAVIVDAVTNTASTALRLSHTTVGTAAANFGVRTVCELENAANAKADAAYLDALWTNATGGTEASAYAISLRTAGGPLTESLRVIPGGGVQLAGAAPGISATTAAANLTLTPGAGAAVVAATAFIARNGAGAQVLGVRNVGIADVSGIATEYAASAAGGNVTLNAVRGRFRVLATQGIVPLIITNNRVIDATSTVLVSCRGTVAGGVPDATLTTWAAVASAGSFAFAANANATADTDFDFLVLNT